MTSLSVLNIQIRRDSEGRYSLNDLHKAAVAAGANKRTKEPSKFLASQSVQDFVSELDTQNPGIATLVQLKGGKIQGTFAVELLAIRYAAWVSPAFEITVYKTFQAVAKGELERAQALATRRIIKDEYLPLTDAIKQSKALEGKPAKHYHFSNENNLIYRVLLGVDAKKYKAQNGVATVRDHLTPVEQEALLSLQRANTSMIELGYDYHHRKEELERLYQRLWFEPLRQENILLEA